MVKCGTGSRVAVVSFLWGNLKSGWLDGELLSFSDLTLKEAGH